jgi:DMSO/TMAO reductase YedYZ heme-binding membrane subunit
MKAILAFQNVLIKISVVLLIFIPASSLFFDPGFEVKGIFYTISFTAVFLVMFIRPMADIFINHLWLRRLVILRKGFGILSASIIVGFMIASIIAPDSVYLASFFTKRFWSFETFSFWAHLGDVSGVILLLTSNVFSQRILKQNWKRIQRLSYVYFYAGGIYEAFALDSTFAFYSILLITNLTVLAWAIKVWRRLPDVTENSFNTNARIA